ncbi:MAG TPA: L-threonine 3-dehydrogenase [Deinococcales bacterium]|nr:L-threonine 3-dehydrogenase [Deinococcales bacterium]
MRALEKPAPQPGARVIELDAPQPGIGEILVRVRATSVCGTDMHIYNWDAWGASRFPAPMVFGHECSGEVVAVGPGVDPLMVKVGDHVSAETHIACGRCLQCRTGRKHICQNLRILGVDVPGVFAEYVVIPAVNAWVNDPDLPFEVASVQEPFGNAVQTVMAGPGVSCRTVLVTGCGPIGLMAILVARANGATLIVASDVNDRRLELARQFGADLTLNPTRDDVVKRTRDATRGNGVDTLLEFSGNAAAIRDGFGALTYGGHASLLGLPSGRVEFDLANDIVFKACTVEGISGRRMFETWFQVREMVTSGRVDLRRIITHELGLTDFERGFELVRRGEAVKIVMHPEA